MEIFTLLETLEDIYLSIGTLRYTAGYVINLLSDNKANIEDILIELELGGTKAQLEERLANL